jgi:drug/metabolite transporter (DMT)-like permease
MMYSALLQGTVGVVSPIVAVYPVFTLALSAMLLRQEQMGMRMIAGVALTVAGVIWLLVR